LTNFRMKYAPQTLDEAVFPSVNAKQIVTDVANLTSPDHIILYGPYGTGKTTAAKLMRKLESVVRQAKLTSCTRR